MSWLAPRAEGCVGFVDPSIADAPAGTRYQFEHPADFCADPDTAPGKPVFNRTVTLRDRWAKVARDLVPVRLGLLQPRVYNGARGQGRWDTMIRTVEALVDEQGAVQLLEPLGAGRPRRALVTILEEPPHFAGEAALLSEAALADDWLRPEEDAAWSHLQSAR